MSIRMTGVDLGFFNPCTFVDSHTKVQEHDTDFMACLIGSKFGVTGRSSRLAFHVVPPFPSPYSFEVATYGRGTPQGSTLARFSLSQIDDWLHVAFIRTPFMFNDCFDMLYGLFVPSLLMYLLCWPLF